MKTKEQIAKYNKEYFARPSVIARAKIRNAQRRGKRKQYKKTEAGILANKKYLSKESTKLRMKKQRMVKRYGIDIDMYKALVDEQKGKCLICSVFCGDKLHIDHCHKTGVVRGLLCGSCNRALGLLKDSPDFLSNAISYLLK